ncbi:MAG: PQQ-dependent sugar dehydrogenase [Myxococcota bacterium]
MIIKSVPGDNTRHYVVQQAGQIRLIKDGTLQAQAFLDISNLVHQPSGGDERGLLGLAFHPNYLQNGRFFVFYTREQGSPGDQVVAEYHRSDANHDVADAAAVQVLMTLADAESNHNGGTMEFSPVDGYLYIGLGDEGGAGDQHGPYGNALNLGEVWGKIFRIDVSTTPYAIPAGNMTTVPAGNPYPNAAVVPEIWDYGVRNPWRMSFDACTGDLYIGDVGQGAWEEIDVEPAGQGNRNYGWKTMEGTHCYQDNTESCDRTGLTLPVVEYSHSQGCSVTGGYVYRGSIPGLRGRYFYGDYCSGLIWSFTYANGQATDVVDHSADLSSFGLSIASFGQDNNGEVYVVTLSGNIYRIDAE